VRRPVFILSVVSFLTDISSEMIYPLVPLFLTSVIGAPLAVVGLIEGLAEGTASGLKTLSGWLSDRLGVRKPLVVLGYCLSALAKPLLAVAYVWPAALGVRLVDRAGKGMRTAPRDAMVADATPERLRGRAFGFHRAADTLGAVAGPAIGLGLLAALDQNFRLIFVLALIPALGGVALLGLVADSTRRTGPQQRTGVKVRELGKGFYLFLGISLVFAFGNSSDAFLILRSVDLGLSHIEAVSAYIVFNAVYAALATPAGILSDRLGRRTVMGLGFGVFAVVYLALGLASSAAVVWPLFAVYGLHMALTEGIGRAFVADLVPSPARATALGVYHGALGGMVLLSSVIAGLMWDHIDPAAPFFLGGATSLGALVALVGLTRRVMPQRV
jgi:MFS family permease